MRTRASLILRTTIPALLPLFLVFSVFIFLRGHNEPGGGFSAGLVASAAFALMTVAFGPDAGRRALGLQPQVYLGAGILLSGVSLLMPLAAGKPMGEGMWTTLSLLGREVKVGTPLAFDLGVLLVVVGTASGIVFALAEERD
ncbi:MAG: MnhB domain-containing protein [Chloroflexota bacterium]|nr:Na(+)/H(+) antiporter subunit B [Dehalococcoidia bacterium]MDW8046242.1 MnhB domain-containing protein [Chloroflexota bacterium]